MQRAFLGTFLLSVLASAHAVRGDAFGHGPNAFAIDFVTIGDPGNAADFHFPPVGPRQLGAVAYSYRIGKYEVSREMIDKANAEGGLGITLADMTPYGGNGSSRPATGVSWFEAAQFVNWLNTSTGNAPAYKFDALGDFQLWAPGDAGYNANNLFRNSLAKYFLPSVDEWYKAAYYDPVAGMYWNYPTGSNIPPTAVASGAAPGTAVVMQGIPAGPADIMQAGGLSPYGTMAQGGNAWEWEETALDLSNDVPFEQRGGRGAGWAAVPSSLSATLRSGGFPELPPTGAGLRVASIIPEPTASTILATVAPLFLRRRRTELYPHAT